jgi:hypothetical protein
MSLSLQTTQSAKNPLDVMEQIVAANEWVFDRRSDAEMAAEAPGKWCDYGLYFAWSSEISAMHFTCTFDIKVPAPRRHALYELLARANEKLWIATTACRCSATPCCCAARPARPRKAWKT